MERFWSCFYEIYEAMPRQGPGDRASTERALKMLPPLTERHRILDIGCGSGTQTLDLAGMTGARITAVDNHPPFVGQIQSKIDRLGLGSRVTAQVADMNDLPFPDGSFDVIWSEGSIFIIGFARGLSAWRRLLAPGGHMVVSDFCWFRDNPPAELKEMFIEGCPDAGNAAIMQKAVAENGYELIGEFTLPETGWWENYLVPLDKCLKRFREAHAGDPEALAVADRSGHEIELYKRHPGVYGYEFFVMRRG